MGKGMVILGLIGFPLDHSWSPQWFQEKFRSTGNNHAEYRLFPLKNVSEFPILLAKYPELAGLNVTIPHKEKILPYLDELDATARLIGAVNTIQITRMNGIVLTKGFNTDAPGFSRTLTDHVPRGPALVLGTGGGSKAVAHVLQEKNIPHIFVSRNKTGPGIISYEDLTFEVISNHLLIINTTPVGMFPDTHLFPPIPYHMLTGAHCLYDLIYNPAETEFMKRGKTMKARAVNGMQMLVNQAELSYNIFFGKD
ncbi:MAG: shikimate dehydrogenase [Bacteroidetes bacterium]|nr:shikimate dehydrogenase [Bacteroidota bacterium]